MGGSWRTDSLGESYDSLIGDADDVCAKGGAVGLLCVACVALAAEAYARPYLNEQVCSPEKPPLLVIYRSFLTNGFVFPGGSGGRSLQVRECCHDVCPGGDAV